MPRPDPDPKRPLDAIADGLKHNPFAKLRPDGKPAPAQPVERAHAASAQAESAKDAPAKGAPAKVLSKERLTVRREKKGHGGKTVTIAEGPAFTGRKLDELAREAARSLGVGARVEGMTLVVQGDQADRFVTWLTQRGFVNTSRGN